METPILTEEEREIQARRMVILPILTGAIKAIIFAAECAVKFNLIEKGAKRRVTQLHNFVSSWNDTGEKTLKEAQKKQYKDFQSTTNSLVIETMKFVCTIGTHLEEIFADRIQKAVLQTNALTGECTSEILANQLTLMGYEVQTNNLGWVIKNDFWTISITSGNVLHAFSNTGDKIQLCLWNLTLGLTLQFLEPILFLQQQTTKTS